MSVTITLVKKGGGKSVFFGRVFPGISDNNLLWIEDQVTGGENPIFYRWRIDLAQLANDTPNKRGLYWIRSHSPGDVDVVNPQPPPISANLFESAYALDGDRIDILDKLHDTFTIGLLLTRRLNGSEGTNHELILFTSEASIIHTNLPITRVNSFMDISQTWPLMKANPPLKVKLTSANTFSGTDPVTCTFRVQAAGAKVLDGWETMFLKASKGSVPMTCPIDGKIGTFIYDPTGTAPGDVINIKVGIDYLLKSDTITLTRTS